MLKGKHILLGITGSIAAYKIPLLVRLLIKEGAEVRIAMTPSARDFVTPLTLSTLSKNPVLSEPFDPVDGSWNSHVDLGRWADLMLVAPASANTLAKMAHGIADNFLLTTFLSAKCPVYFAPAMDLDMFHHPATQQNIKSLEAMGCKLIEPQVGELASGLCGAGRMEEPEIMLEILRYGLTEKDLAGYTALVTAGPTQESIDPVRYISNHSSGLMGYAIAETLASRGAVVHLVSGPVHRQTYMPGIQLISVTTAAEMYEACMQHTNADVIVMAAAVADFAPSEPVAHKIKKTTQHTALPLTPTIDILSALSKNRRNVAFLAGFALETDNEEENALQKLRSKNLDMIILNSLSNEGAGFGVDTNVVSIFTRNGESFHLPKMLKTELAERIVDLIHEKLTARK